MSGQLPKSIVFITGTSLSHQCWDEWQRYFESNGYRCMAPPWPYKDASPEELRNRPPYDLLASNRLAAINNYFEGIISEMPEQPILIGHSMGGLIVQLLLQHGMGSAGVAMHSFPPSCVPGSRLSLLKSLWVSMSMFTSKRKTYLVTFRKWKNVFANGMDCDEQKTLYYKYAIPESKLLLRDVFTSAAMIDFKKPHVPLLFTSGYVDAFIPALMNYNNYRRYSSRDSVTAYKEFKDSNHLVFDPPAMKAEAAYVLHWLQGIE